MRPFQKLLPRDVLSALEYFVTYSGNPNLLSPFPLMMMQHAFLFKKGLLPEYSQKWLFGSVL